jgi:XTP/dITP diphosphohydrolase
MKTVADEITVRNAWPAPGLYGLGPRANFISVLCLAWPNGEAQFFEGKVFGHLVWPPRGGNGFGYDPIFVAEGQTETFGEMEPAQKYAISHRTRAFAAFKAQCLEHIGAEPVSEKIAGRDVAVLTAAAASLSTREELAEFVSRLREDLHANATAWPTATLEAYLLAVQSALSRMPETNDPKWRTLANVLLAASLHE